MFFIIASDPMPILQTTQSSEMHKLPDKVHLRIQSSQILKQVDAPNSAYSKSVALWKDGVFYEVHENDQGQRRYYKRRDEQGGLESIPSNIAAEVLKDGVLEPQK